MEHLTVDNQKSYNRAAIPFKLRFVAGWCSLDVGEPAHSVELAATTMRNCLPDLISAFERVVCGSLLESVLWGGEGQGWFIEMSARPRAGLAVAVHLMRDPGWHSPEDVWLPVRGECVFERIGGAAQTAVLFAHECQRVQREEADSTGYMRNWGWRFPEGRFELLEAAVAPSGYRPTAQ